MSETKSLCCVAEHKAREHKKQDPLRKHSGGPLLISLKGGAPNQAESSLFEMPPRSAQDSNLAVVIDAAI